MDGERIASNVPRRFRIAKRNLGKFEIMEGARVVGQRTVGRGSGSH